MGRYKADQLHEDILTIQEISCSKCRERNDLMNIDDFDAADIFFKNGWRRTERHCYCPKCAKKHLKKK